MIMMMRGLCACDVGVCLGFYVLFYLAGGFVFKLADVCLVVLSLILVVCLGVDSLVFWMFMDLPDVRRDVV